MFKLILISLFLVSCASSPVATEHEEMVKEYNNNTKSVVIVVLCNLPVFITINDIHGSTYVVHIDPTSEADLQNAQDIANITDNERLSIESIDEQFNAITGIVCT